MIVPSNTSSAQSVPSSIAGYTVLTLLLPRLPSFPDPAFHHLYLAPHEPKIPTPTAPRSLFLVNVPFDATEAHIKHLFSTQLYLSHGRIEDVEFEAEKKRENGHDSFTPQPSTKAKGGQKRKRVHVNGAIEDEECARLPSTWDRKLQRPGGTAVVLFVDRASRDAVIKEAKRSKKEILWGDGIEQKLPQLGSARYLNHNKLSYPEKTALLESVNSYMTVFAEREASQARAKARQRQMPDADGFVTVTRGGRTGPAKQVVAQVLAKKQKEKLEGLKDFYRFQMRERQKARAGELLRKFEQDKQKVNFMKERRGAFKPE